MKNEYTENIINKLQFGDIILFHRRMIFPVGFLIQCFLGSYYSHIGIYYGDGQIIDAIPFTGVSVHKFERQINTKFCVLRLKNTLSGTESEIQLISWLNAQLGKGYDYPAFFYMFIFFIFMKLKIIGPNWRKQTNPVDDPHKFFCFQFVAEAFRPFNIMPVNYLNAIDTDFLESNKFEKIVED